MRRKVTVKSIGHDEWYDESFICEECDKLTIMRSFHYCPVCGNEIDWEGSENND